MKDELKRYKELCDMIFKVALEKIPEDESTDDDPFLVCDYAAGNIDDAYSLGNDSGRVEFARELKEILSQHD